MARIVWFVFAWLIIDVGDVVTEVVVGFDVVVAAAGIDIVVAGAVFDVVFLGVNIAKFFDFSIFLFIVSV